MRPSSGLGTFQLGPGSAAALHALRDGIVMPTAPPGTRPPAAQDLWKDFETLEKAQKASAGPAGSITDDAPRACQPAGAQPGSRARQACRARQTPRELCPPRRW